MTLTLGALSAFGPLSMDLYLPALPELGRDLGAQDAVAQLTMSLCVVGLAVGQLVVGPFSDRIGRRRPLLVGVGTYALASLLCAFAGNIWLLIALRLVQGMAGAAGIVLSRAMVRDLFDETRAARAFSTLIIISGVAPVVAPIVGAQLTRITDWRGMFVALAAIGVLLFAASAALPETLPPDARQTGGGRTLRDFAALGRDRRFLGYAAVLALASCALFTYISLSPFVLQDGYHLTAQQFSAVFAVNSLGILAAGYLNRALIGRYTPDRLLLAGILVGLAGAFTTLLAVRADAGLVVLLPGLFLLVASLGVVMPNTMARAMSRHGARAGSASALLGSLQFIVGGAVPPLLSAGGATGLSLSSAVTICEAIALGLFAAMLLARHKPQEEIRP